jgi:hypothetical protein
MADPTALNGQITDAVTQANVKVLGDAPAQALGTVYQTAAQVVSLAMQNATAAQQQLNTVSQAVTTQGANSVLTLDTTATARASLALTTGNDLATQLAQLLASAVSGQQAAKIGQTTPPVWRPRPRSGGGGGGTVTGPIVPVSG